MTCIVAIVENGVPYFAGDAILVSAPSQYHSNVGQNIIRSPKVFQKGGMLFGFNGSVRMGQILQYDFELPEYHSGQDKKSYLVAHFIKLLQEGFKEAKYQEESLEGGILLALEGQLFTISDEFGVCDPASPYEAIGKGSQVAIGSLHTTAQLGLPPRERLYLALAAAERHTCVVSAPYTYITTGMEQAEPLLPAASIS